MHHGKHLKRLGRKTTLHRQDMLRNMLTSLIKHGRIETTWTKAKSLQRLADKV
jgi:ribosomal protein L17